MTTTVVTETYTKEEILEIITKWIPEGAAVQAAWPDRAHDQIALFINPEEDEDDD